MRTKYATLSNAELVQLHRWDIQGDDLVEELWHRLENGSPEQEKKIAELQEEIASLEDEIKDMQEELEKQQDVT